jgi:O-antigen/teichoic acid export membrane protein
MSVLAKNIKFNLIGQVFVILLGFISFKFIYQDLGEDALGIIYFTYLISGVIASSLDIGLTKTTTREIAGNSNDTDYVIKLIQTFSLLYWSAYVVVIVFFVLLLPNIVNSWINLTTMEGQLAQYVLLILGITSLLSIPKMLMSSVFIGLQRMDINNTIEVAVTAIQQLGIVALLVTGHSIIIVAYWIAALSVLKVLAYIYFIIKLLSIEAIFPKFHKEVVVRVKSYTGKMMWVSLLLVVHKQFDKIMVSKFLPIGVLGVYSFAYASISKTSLITGAVAQAVFPSFSESIKQGELDQSRRLYFTLQDLLVFGTVPIFVSVAFFSTPVFSFLLDSEKAHNLQITAILLSLYFYFHAIMRLVRTYIFAKGEPESAIRADVISLFTVTPLTVLLVYYYGIEGAAFSSVLYYVVMAAVIIPRVYLKEFKQPAISWLQSVLTVMLLVCFTYVPAGYIAYAYYADNAFFLLLFYITASFAYGFCAINVIGEGLQKVLVNYVPILRIFIFNRYLG